MELTNDHRNLITALMPEVMFDGWTEKALLNAADLIGISHLHARDLFPNGAADMIAAHSVIADEKMLTLIPSKELDAMGVTDRISMLVMARFEDNTSDREAIRRAVSVLSTPGNSAVATRLLFETVDAIWNAAGDQSEDYNYYTKRGLLAAVYSSAVLVWFDDQSDDFSDTKAFLDRRLQGVVKTFGRIGKFRAGMEKYFPNLPDPLSWIKAPNRNQ